MRPLLVLTGIKGVMELTKTASNEVAMSKNWRARLSVSKVSSEIGTVRKKLKHMLVRVRQGVDAWRTLTSTVSEERHILAGNITLGYP